MSDSNRTRTSLVAESTPGTTPATPTMLVVPKSSFSARPRPSYQESAIIRADANIQGVYKVSNSVSGQLATELMYSASGESIYALLAAAMRSTPSAAVSYASGNVLTGETTITRASGSFITDGFAVGDIVKVTGSPDDGYYRLSGVQALTLGLEGAFWSDDDASVTVTRGLRMANGTTDTHFSLEHARLDEDLYQIMRGMALGGMGLRIADEQITQLTFDFEGMNGARAATEYGNTYTDHTDRESFVAVNIPIFKVGGVAYEAMDIAIDVNNRVRGRRRVGAEGPTSIRRGSFAVTGTVNCYLDSWAELNKYDAGTASDIWLVQTDSAGNAIGVSIPQVKWTDAGTDTRGKDQDDFAALTFQAELDSAEDLSMRLQLFPA